MSLYTAGITMTLDSGALVAVEKVQRKTGRQRDAWHDGIKGREDVYETVARIVGVAALSGSVPDMVAQIAARLLAEPMKDDTHARIDVGSLGRPVLRPFRDRGLHPWSMIIGGEKEATDKHATVTLPVSALQSVAALMFQQKRIEFGDTLLDGPTLQHALRNLDKLPESGPARDLGIAAGLAVWSAYTHASTYPWVSSKPIPRNLDEEWARRARRLAIARAVASAEGRPWWTVAAGDLEDPW